jgi:hypothetical protein
MRVRRVAAAGLLLACALGAQAHPLELSSARPRSDLTGSFVWQLQFANGMRAEFRTTDGRAGAVQGGVSDWFLGSKRLGTRNLDMQAASFGLLVTVERTEEEDQLAASTRDDVPGREALQAKMDATLDRMAVQCHALPEPRYTACTMQFNAPMEAIAQSMARLEDAARAKAERIGVLCAVLKLRVLDGKVSGKADYCAGEPGVAVTGTVRPVR